MEIFNIKSNSDFEAKCIEVFKYQSKNCPVYKQYIELLGVNPNDIISYNQIPMLPIRFFKSKKIISDINNDCECDVVFTSSATTGMIPSKHYVKDLEVYKQSFIEGFRFFMENQKSL
jgi:Acyl-protein synthetase, LuxE.